MGRLLLSKTSYEDSSVKTPVILMSTIAGTTISGVYAPLRLSSTRRVASLDLNLSDSGMLNSNLFEFFLIKRNDGKSGRDREHLTVVCATSGDTGSASIYGLRGKKDVSIFVMYPTGKVRALSPPYVAARTTMSHIKRSQMFEHAMLTPSPGEPNTRGPDDNRWVIETILST